MGWEKCEYKGYKPKGRAGHVSFFHKDKLYCFGGYDSSHVVLGDLFSFDLSNENLNCEEFKCNKVVPDLQRRWSSGVFEETSEQLFLFGGWNEGGSLGDICSFSFKNKIWKKVEKVAKPWSARRWHSSVLFGESNSVLIFGGYNGNTEPLGDLMSFDLGSQKMRSLETKGNKIKARCRHTALKLDSKTMLITSGLTGRNNVVKEMDLYHTDDGVDFLLFSFQLTFSHNFFHL